MLRFIGSSQRAQTYFFARSFRSSDRWQTRSRNRRRTSDAVNTLWTGRQYYSIYLLLTRPRWCRHRLDVTYARFLSIIDLLIISRASRIRSLSTQTVFTVGTRRKCRMLNERGLGLTRVVGCQVKCHPLCWTSGQRRIEQWWLTVRAVLYFSLILFFNLEKGKPNAYLISVTHEL